MKLFLQIVGLFALLLCVTLVTLSFKHRAADGPSLLFPGGKLVSGELHQGAEPDWSFTDDVATFELETSDPVSSRTIWLMESDGKLYVGSAYMRSMLGRLWKDWAFDVEEAGARNAVARIEGVRYERELIRVMDPKVLEGVAKKSAMKYLGGETPGAVAQAMKSYAEGDVWVFELAPRSS